VVLHTVCHARQESINISKEKKSAQIAKSDARRTLQGTIKLNVCCVMSVKRLHELEVQSVKIVVLASTVMVVKNVTLVSIAHLRLTILQHVLHAVLEDINLILGKQAVYRAHLESINTLKEKKHVRTVKLDV